MVESSEALLDIEFGVQLVMALVVVGGALLGGWRYFNGRINAADQMRARELDEWRAHVQAETTANSNALVTHNHRLERVDARLQGIDERETRTVSKLDQLIAGQAELKGEVDTLLRLMQGQFTSTAR